MHILDGVLNPQVCGVTGAISIAAVGYSLHKLRNSLADRMVPLTGMMAALIFAGQMVNFPLIGTPVSGHLMGGVLAAVLLGPWAGCVAITLVLIVQFALFSDGGMLALGANVLHMGVVGSWGGYAVYAAVRRLLGNTDRGTVVGAVVASWLSVMAAAALFCLEFWLSWHRTESAYDFTNILTLMVTLHSAIGIGEALITGAVVSFVLAQRPDLIYAPEAPTGVLAGVGRAATAGVVCALAVSAFLAPFASGYPDGLEAVSEKTAMNRSETDVATLGFGDYKIPLPIAGWQQSGAWQKVSVSLAGLLGTVVVLMIALLLGRTLRPRTSMAESSHVE